MGPFNALVRDHLASIVRETLTDITGAAALWHVYGGRRASAVAAMLSDAKLGVPSRLVQSCAGDLLYEESSKVDEAAIVGTLCIFGLPYAIVSWVCTYANGRLST